MANLRKFPPPQSPFIVKFALYVGYIYEPKFRRNFEEGEEIKRIVILFEKTKSVKRYFLRRGTVAPHRVAEEATRDMTPDA